MITLFGIYSLVNFSSDEDTLAAEEASSDSFCSVDHCLPHTNTRPSRARAAEKAKPAATDTAWLPSPIAVGELVGMLVGVLVSLFIDEGARSLT